jgi:Zn-dependent peptidase ImmA (M78 family)
MSEKTQETLGTRLRRRREEFGASVVQTAGWADLEPERLARIEGGSPSASWEFEAICRALAVDSGAMARGLDRTPRRSVARFRSAPWEEPAPEDFRTLSLAAELGRIGGFLAQEVDRPSRLSSLRSPEPINEHEEPWRQGYRLGELARRAMAPQSDPIRNLEELLTDWGVHIARVAFSSTELDAASLWETDSIPIILLNTRSIRSRSALSRRALLAHELCHLLHDSGERELTTELSWNEGWGNYSTRTEQRARAFAPAFLAPRDEVKHWFKAGSGSRIRLPESKVRRLAERWGFSLRGATWHAKNCGLISPQTAKELDRHSSDLDHGWSADFEQPIGEADGPLSGGEIAPIADGLLSMLVAEAAAKNVISEGRGREIVTWG